MEAWQGGWKLGGGRMWKILIGNVVWEGLFCRGWKRGERVYRTMKEHQGSMRGSGLKERKERERRVGREIQM